MKKGDKESSNKPFGAASGPASGLPSGTPSETTSRSPSETTSGQASPAGRSFRTGGNSLIALAFVLMFVGIIFANSTFNSLKAAASYETWATAKATVVDCINERAGVFGSGVPHDYQRVTSQFATAGRIVRSHFRSDDWKYHTGETIEMRFDPFEPSHCMVNPRGTGRASLWSAIAFAVFFVSGFSLLICALKHARKQGKKQGKKQEQEQEHKQRHKHE
jgi:hypothetical protein